MLLSCGWSRWSRPRWRGCQIGWDVCHQEPGRFWPLTDVWDQRHMQVTPEGWSGAQRGKWLDFPSSLYLGCRGEQGQQYRGENFTALDASTLPEGNFTSWWLPKYMISSTHALSLQRLSLSQLSDMQWVRNLPCFHLQDQNYIHTLEFSTRCFKGKVWRVGKTTHFQSSFMRLNMWSHFKQIHLLRDQDKRLSKQEIPEISGTFEPKFLN